MPETVLLDLEIVIMELTTVQHPKIKVLQIALLAVPLSGVSIALREQEC
jgi:hypothetical protein